MTPAQLVHDHWEFMKRLTNDDDEAQQLALHVLETFEQFKPKCAAFSQFIKLKLRELRQHYSDKGVVAHTCRAESAGYVSLDANQVEGGDDDEEVEVGLYNLIAASLSPPDVPRRFVGLYYEWTKPKRPAHCETLNDLGGFRKRLARLPEMAESAKPNWISPKARKKHPQYYKALCEELAEDRERDRGYRPLPARKKRVALEAFRRELIAQVAARPKIEVRIHYAERATGERPLPKDTLWEQQVPDFLAKDWRNKLKQVKLTSEAMTWRRWSVDRRFAGLESHYQPKDIFVGKWCFARRRPNPEDSAERRSRFGPWHKYDGGDSNRHEGTAYVRAYLARNGLALRLPRLKRTRRSPFLTWVLRKQTDEVRVTRAIARENHDLLWAALRVLCYKRKWPPGIPNTKIPPQKGEEEDEFTPRERLLRQAKAVIAASGQSNPLAHALKKPSKMAESHMILTECTGFVLS